MKIKPIIICLLFFGKIMGQNSDVTADPKGETEFFMGILLDQITTLGSLKACPSRQNPKEYYYLPNQVKIAMDDKTGKPKFSFVKYVTNKRSDTEEVDIKEGEGGGWVHFLMGLSVSDNEKAKAQAELQKKVPGAVLKGPIIYKEGTVELVTKAQATNDKIRILGTGPAPILDGDFIAVGFSLNADDATILWETLKGPNPDVSLNFKMTLAGLNSPVGAKVEVNWDIMKKHRLMNLDIDIPIVKVQISDMVTQLKQNGTLKVTTVGGSNIGQNLIKKVEDMIIKLCFSETNIDSVGKVDRSSRFLVNEANRKAKQEAERSREEADKTEFKANLTSEIETEKALKTEADNAEKANNDLKDAEAIENISKKEKQILALKNELETTEREKLILDKKEDKKDNENELKIINGKIAKLKIEIESETKQKRKLEEEQKKIVKTRLENSTSNKKELATKAKEIVSETKEKIADLTGFTKADLSITAIYHRAKVERSGTLFYDLNNYEPTTIKETFGGNIGKINCPTCIIEVNTASHLYTQRELIARLDGEAARNDNFGKYINHVTVRMRKKHGAGDLTFDEVRIDRKNFNKEGNIFKLLYGWQKGDNNRNNWLDYDYQTSWNFFGGYTINQPWQQSNNQVIAISPPFARSEIKIIAEKEALISANIRAAFVKIYYKMGENEFMKKATITPKNEVQEQIVSIIHSQNELNYEYEIDWVFKDGHTKQSGRKASNNDIIFVDIF
jgi:hypothetical protein